LRINARVEAIVGSSSTTKIVGLFFVDIRNPVKGNGL
jgi:hypothetical protein